MKPLIYVCLLITALSCMVQNKSLGTTAINSGLEIGQKSPAFDPQHAWGPDKGSHACPMCKYGYHPGVMYFLNADDNWNDVKIIIRRLEEESIRRKEKKFKAYLIYTNPGQLTANQIEYKLQKLGAELNIENMALTYVLSASDKKSYVYLHKINPSAFNTLIVYNQRHVCDKFINFVPSQQQFSLLFDAVDKAGY